MCFASVFVFVLFFRFCFVFLYVFLFASLLVSFSSFFSFLRVFVGSKCSYGSFVDVAFVSLGNERAFLQAKNDHNTDAQKIY